MNMVEMQETGLLEDAELVGLCLHGDRDAFGRMVESEDYRKYIANLRAIGRQGKCSSHRSIRLLLYPKVTVRQISIEIPFKVVPDVRPSPKADESRLLTPDFAP